jgi:hypothetical protein
MTLQHQAQFSTIPDHDSEPCPHCTDGTIRTPKLRSRWIGGSKDGYRSERIAYDTHLCESCQGSQRVPSDAALKREAQAAINVGNLARALDCLDRLRDRRDHPVREVVASTRSEVAS